MHPIINRLQAQVLTWKQLQISPETIRIMMKESLQDEILCSLYTSRYGQDLVFIGGTALRKLHQLPRFSEDLDFTALKPIPLTDLGKVISQYFSNQQFPYADYSIQENTLLHRLTMKFALLQQVGLSPLASEKLHVKVEMTIAQNQYPVLTQVVTLANHPLAIPTYSLNKSMASKILACLNRVYKKGTTGITIKGRDYFDLIWYLSQKIVPDSKVFTDFDSTLSTSTILHQLDQKVSLIQPNDLLADLQYYFEDPNLAPNWCRNFHQMYTSATQYLRHNPNLPS